MDAPQQQAEQYVLKSWLDAAAIIDEKWYGPLPDVVSTQGLYLKPHPDTPIYSREYDPEFIKNLELRLNVLRFVQKLRRDKYGDEAEEWPPSHTPRELKERWKAERDAEQRRIQAILEITTSDDEPPASQAVISPKKRTRISRKRRRTSPCSSSTRDRKHMHQTRTSWSTVSCVESISTMRPNSCHVVPQELPRRRDTPGSHSTSPVSPRKVTLDQPEHRTRQTERPMIDDEPLN